MPGVFIAAELERYERMNENDDKARKAWEENKATLEGRVSQFHQLELPGQSAAMHMGTCYLINDLWRRVKELEEELEIACDIATGRGTELKAAVNGHNAFLATWLRHCELPGAEVISVSAFRHSVKQHLPEEIKRAREQLLETQRIRKEAGHGKA